MDPQKFRGYHLGLKHPLLLFLIRVRSLRLDYPRIIIVLRMLGLWLRLIIVSLSYPFPFFTPLYLDGFHGMNKNLLINLTAIFRALNAICHQALDIKPDTQDAADFLAYCSVVFEFMHHHHIMEEKHYFPDLEKATGIKDLMSTNIQQHEKLDSLVGKLMRYAETTSKDNYNGNDLLIMIEELARPYEEHMHEEIGTILELHGKIGSRDLERIDGKMRGEAEKFSDIFKFVPPYPFILPCLSVLTGRIEQRLSSSATKIAISPSTTRRLHSLISTFLFLILSISCLQGGIRRFGDSIRILFMDILVHCRKPLTKILSRRPQWLVRRRWELESGVSTEGCI